MAEAVVGLYGRQSDIFNPENPAHQKQVVLVGAGTIGSWLGLALSKLGVDDLIVIDPDSVELHNIPNQFFIQSQCGKSKVSSLSALLKGLGYPKMRGAYGKITPDNFDILKENISITKDTIFVSCVDNMEARKAVFEIATTLPNVKFFVDGRMAGQFIRVFSIDLSNKEDVNFYRSTLHNDDTSDIKNDEVKKASEVPCTAKSIVDVSMVIAGKMCGSIRKFSVGDKCSRDFNYDAKNDLVLIL